MSKKPAKRDTGRLAGAPDAGRVLVEPARGKTCAGCVAGDAEVLVRLGVRTGVWELEYCERCFGAVRRDLAAAKIPMTKKRKSR